jgi:hypothetical protein
MYHSAQNVMFQASNSTKIAAKRINARLVISSGVTKTKDRGSLPSFEELKTSMALLYQIS